MQQFGAPVFQMVVHWHKLGDVENKCTLHNSVALAINVPKIIKVSKNLTKLWQKQFWLFFLRHDEMDEFRNKETIYRSI